ncbi:tetraacyldisaccharide 4'-kinase [Aliivibrio fischeri]|uniref:tetraacyldisaccharide 4'-kinase n=1 Tax=Aliivibrio fischeri TaxID=668 RepID=UPI0007C49442|nr:tetraacyldisaccharide 4'-kinase [Aliivibrio fischeri]MBP3139207.1 tetraacyldisaccharide 4'-kinase [Aliivibrio fischeri]MBP3154797.1 tetraacyldisaccharide 4'-kinase [Aliivibrio fischeri]MCE7574545.1 tetraacyldisaccharide 4'-kinase [Aliivibrio fischeri]
MIEKIWFDNHFLGKLLWPLLWPLSCLFKWIATKRKSDYQSGKKQSYRSSVPVVVVGNITAGGNGKTPVVVWLVEQLQSKGYKVGVASRGYGGKAPHYPYLLTESTTPDISGDEPVLIKQRTKAEVAVAPVRSEAVKMLEQQGVDFIITDDGLQHYALQRDIEFIVIDGKRRFGNQHYIPLGPLREGVERLSSVDFLICNGGEPQENEVLMRLQPSEAINLVTGERRSVSSLSNLVAFAGIGHPPRFFETLNQLKANVVHTQGFEDHKAFEPTEIEQLMQYGEQLIMTEKDAVKCQSFAQSSWWYLPVDAIFPEEKAQQILNKIIEVKE